MYNPELVHILLYSYIMAFTRNFQKTPGPFSHSLLAGFGRLGQLQACFPQVLQHATHKTASNVVQRMLEHADVSLGGG